MKKIKGANGWGIIFGILMILLGITAMINPFDTIIVVTWIFVFGMLVLGVSQIIRYIKTPAEKRNGFLLASGILALILFIMIIPFNGEEGLLGSFLTMMFMLGFLSISTGINQLVAVSALRSNGATGTGWLTASGIISIVLGIFFLSNPIGMGLVQGVLMGIYLVMGGIALIAASASK